MDRKVFFDTNFIRNTKMSSYFGNANELKKFANYGAKILIPETVISEIDFQKTKEWREGIRKLLTNPVFVQDKSTDELNLYKESKREYALNRIQELKENTEFDYLIIPVPISSEYLTEISKLAIKNLPPFDEKSDKGFKDTLIAFTIKDYIINNHNDNLEVYFLTNDKRLKQYFNESKLPIDVVEDFQEFENIVRTKEEYFQKVIEEELDLTSEVREFVVSESGNVIVQTEEDIILRDLKGNITFTLNGLTHEMPDYYVNGLSSSPNFASTHIMISHLETYIDFLTSNQISNIFSALYKNNQVGWIVSDSDVNKFYKKLYKKYSYLVPSDYQETILNELRIDEVSDEEN